VVRGRTCSFGCSTGIGQVYTALSKSRLRKSKMPTRWRIQLATASVLAVSSVSALAVTDLIDVNEGSWDVITWSHRPISGNISSATLSVNAWDIDSSSGEVDILSVFDSHISNWVALGQLFGSDDQYSTTTFSLPSTVLANISTGLDVRVDVAVGWPNRTTWYAQVHASTLDAVTTAVPEPATLGMMLGGIALLVRTGKTRFRRLA
jgi:hypothetical protein